jgi:FixJ family two-component response regulator
VIRTPPAVVVVVDDDPSVRRGVARLLRIGGFEVQVFASAEEFLATPGPPTPACYVLDVQLPGLSGLELCERIRRQGGAVPVVFITAHEEYLAEVPADLCHTVWLRKPFEAPALLSAVRKAAAPPARA